MSDAPPVPRCPVTGKHSFASMEAARAVMRKLSARLRAYRCEHCHRVHLTSQGESGRGGRRKRRRR